VKWGDEGRSFRCSFSNLSASSSEHLSVLELANLGNETVEPLVNPNQSGVMGELPGAALDKPVLMKAGQASQDRGLEAGGLDAQATDGLERSYQKDKNTDEMWLAATRDEKGSLPRRRPR
jgi:hypothetical protein